MTGSEPKFPLGTIIFGYLAAICVGGTILCFVSFTVTVFNRPDTALLEGMPRLPWWAWLILTVVFYFFGAKADRLSDSFWLTKKPTL